jgi:nitrate reductase NapE component
MPVKARLNHLNLRDFRNYFLYLSGILVEVLAVALLMGIGFLIAWIVPLLRQK